MSNRIRIPTDELRVGFESAKKQAGNTLRAETSMRIGDPETGAVFANDERTLIFVHGIGDEPGGLFRISASGIPRNKLVYDQPVLVKPTPNGNYRFVSLDDSLDTVFSEGTETSPDSMPVWVNQIRWGTIQPLGNMTVLVVGAFYDGLRVPDIVSAAFDGTALDTSSNPISPPTTNNRVKYVLVQVDPGDDSLEYKQSVEYNASIGFEVAIDNGLVPLPDSQRTRAGYVRLTFGMTSIGYGDIYNTPNWVSQNGEEWPVILTSNRTLYANRQIVLDEITVPSGLTLTIESTAIMAVI